MKKSFRPTVEEFEERKLYAVGLLDTGLDYTHSALFKSVLINQDEIPANVRQTIKDVNRNGIIDFTDLTADVNFFSLNDFNKNGYIDGADLLNSSWENGVDDDRNGLVDDLIGYDFVDNDNDPYDLNGHGTHVGGIILSTNPSSMIYIVRVGDAGGGINGGNAARGIRYLLAENIQVANASWGGPISEANVYNAVAEAAGRMIIVAAAGNYSQNADLSPQYPAGLNQWNNVISVGSINSIVQYSYFSNFGVRNVHVSAYGENILSTWPGNSYKTLSGTSMSTPVVAALTDRILNQYPGSDLRRVVMSVLNSSMRSVNLIGRSMTNGYLTKDTILADPNTQSQFTQTVKVDKKTQKLVRYFNRLRRRQQHLRKRNLMLTAGPSIVYNDYVIQPLDDTEYGVFQ